MTKRKYSTLEDYNWTDIQREHDKNIPISHIKDKYGMSYKLITKACSKGLFIKRKFPRLHTEESKKKLSKIRKNYLKQNPDKHPWKRNNKFKSEPCETFKNILKDNNISFVSEYEPLEDRFYSIDIAFPNDKIGIEINGNQHYDRDGNLLPYYQKRHDKIVSNGWKLYEIPYIKVYDKNFIKEFIQKYHDLELDNIDYSHVIIETKAEKKRKEITKRKRKHEKEKEELINKRKQLIIDNNIDITIFGAYEKISLLWGISPQKVKPFIKNNMPELYKLCYKNQTKI